MKRPKLGFKQAFRYVLDLLCYTYYVQHDNLVSDQTFDELEKRFEEVENLKIVHYPYLVNIKTNEPLYCQCLFEVVSCIKNEMKICKIDRIFIPINYSEWKEWYGINI